MVKIKIAHGGRRAGSGRKPKKAVDLRARLVALTEIEAKADGLGKSRKRAIGTVARDFDEPFETVGSSVRNRKNPEWDLPVPPPPCQCEQDSLPHWHCQHCKTLLGYGTPLTGLLSVRGELGRPVVACDDHCRDHFLENLD
jgi:hypothetical protein